jgi:transposase
VEPGGVGVASFGLWRGLATRYDKASHTYEAGLHLRGSIMWLRLLTSTT